MRDGDVPSRRVSPCTLLSYEGGFHSRWPQRRGEEGEGPPPLFFSPLVDRLVLRLLTALNGRPRAMTCGGCWEEVRL